MEDNEAASGEVMLNKWDPLLALVKCQWNGVKPLAELSTAAWGEHIFIKAFLKPVFRTSLSVMVEKSYLALLNCFKRQFETQIVHRGTAATLHDIK